MTFSVKKLFYKVECTYNIITDTGKDSRTFANKLL